MTFQILEEFHSVSDFIESQHLWVISHSYDINLHAFLMKELGSMLRGRAC